MAKKELYIGSGRFYRDHYEIERNLMIACANICECIALYVAFFITFIFAELGHPTFLKIWIGICIFFTVIIYSYLIKRIKTMKEELNKELNQVGERRNHGMMLRR